MATQLAIVNKVLERLREDTVTSVNDNAYAKLIATFVNDAIMDIEDYNHEWSVYITQIDTTITAGTTSYELTETNDRSWLMRDPSDDQIPLAYDVTSGDVRCLFDASYKAVLRERALADPSNTTHSDPQVFAIHADADGRGWTLQMLWGLKAGESDHTWRSYWYIPQGELARDGTADGTEILLPARIVELRALFYALNERGEEMGIFGGVADKRSTDAIAAAMEADAAVQKRIAEIDMTNRENL